MKRIELPTKERLRGYWNANTKQFEYLLPFQVGSDSFAVEEENIAAELTFARKAVTIQGQSEADLEVREIGSGNIINFFKETDVDEFLKTTEENCFLVYLRTATLAIYVCDNGVREGRFPEEEFPKAGSFAKVTRDQLKKIYTAASQQFRYDHVAKGAVELIILPISS